MTELTDDLQRRCAECIEWQQTGVLRQGALREYAAKHWHGHYDSLQMAERATECQAMQWIAKWGTPSAVAGEPVAWMGTHDKTDLYYRKPPQADVVPLYATPQPTQAQAGAVPLTYQQVIAAWNAQADEHNQWDALGEDEKIEWAVACRRFVPS